MNTGLIISGKIVGQTRPPFPDWNIPIPPEIGGSGQTTLRDLISLVVRQEVSAFRERQEQHRLLRVLKPEQIAAAATKGKIALGGEDFQQEVDDEAAVAAALLAFEDGFYYVFVDDVQGEALEQPVRVAPGSTILFLRLVPLAGG